MKRFAIAVAGVALSVALTGCAGETTPNSQAPSETSASASGTAETGPSGTDTPTPELDPSDGIDDEKGTEGMTLTGTITSGVEAGCLLLEFKGTTYNLIGGDAAVLSPGNEVEVTGTVNEGLMTTCQQGVPFEVDTATAK